MLVDSDFYKVELKAIANLGVEAIASTIVDVVASIFGVIKITGEEQIIGNF